MMLAQIPSVFAPIFHIGNLFIISPINSFLMALILLKATLSHLKIQVIAFKIHLVA